MKRLGKKGKDEAARLEAELAARHAAELAALDSGKEKTAAEAVAVADSLYSVHLGADGEEQQEGHHKVGAAAWAACARQGGDGVRYSAAAACTAGWELSAAHSARRQHTELHHCPPSCGAAAEAEQEPAAAGAAAA